MSQSIFTKVLSKGQGALSSHRRAPLIAIEPVYCVSKRKLENGGPALFLRASTFISNPTSWCTQPVIPV
jgi:hypothetical protein